MVDLGPLSEEELRLLRASVHRQLRTTERQMAKATTPPHRVRINTEEIKVLQRLKTRLNTGLKRARGER